MARLPAWEDLFVPRQSSSDSRWVSACLDRFIFGENTLSRTRIVVMGIQITDLEKMSVVTMSAGVASLAAVGAAGALCQVFPESRMIAETGTDCVCVLGGNSGSDLIVSGGRGPRSRGSNRRAPWLGLYSTSDSNRSSDVSVVPLPNCRDLPTHLDAYDNTTVRRESSIYCSVVCQKLTCSRPENASSLQYDGPHGT